MNFNSFEFILIFLPVVFVLFHTLPALCRIPLLLLSSLVFYGVAGIVPLIFMIVSILWGFVVALITGYTERPIWKVVAIAFPLAVLFLFKYLGFTLDSFGAGDETRDLFLFFLSITLPAGISFYTFQIVAYNLDVHAGRIEAERNPLKLATFISLFPQLIAGPILRYSQMSAQLDRIRTQRKLTIDARSGLKYLSIGLFGKVCVSDLVNVLIKNSRVVEFAQEATRADVLFLLNAYSIRIFFDFWAYSLMAIGIAKLFALDLPVNFREPYQAASPQDFWRRWHVTLSYWLRDYVYIGLGGNDRYMRNIVIVFLACGLWHGAGWSFVIWGAYHAVLVVGYHLTKPVWNRAPKVVQVAVTYALVSLGWPLFFMDLGSYLSFLQVLIDPVGQAGIYSLKHWGLIIPILCWVFFTKEARWLYNDKPLFAIDSPVVHASIAFVAVLFASYSETFIYFRF